MIFRYLILLLLFSIPLFSSEASFEALMGKHTPAWKHIATKEDVQKLEQFSQIYEQGSKRTSQKSIPKILHFIWLGPSPFPEESIPFVRQWIDLHPGWKIKFWTNPDHALPDSRMEKCTQEQFPIDQFATSFFDTESFAERSHILRLAILLNEGGFAIDHDLIPLKSLDPWVKGLDALFVLESLQPTILSSSVFISPHFLASIPSHPLILQCLYTLQSTWAKLGQKYPGLDPASTKNRVMHRVHATIDRVILQKEGASSFCNLVLPSFYFSSKNPKEALYAIHTHTESWVKPPSSYEKTKHQTLEKLQNKVSTLQNLCYGALLLSSISLFFFWKGRWLVKNILSKILPLSLLLLCTNSYASSFEDLMGKGTSHWRHVSQKEDIDFLKFAESLYESNQEAQYIQEGNFQIPTVLHFIWLGDKPFPSSSVENVRSWMREHPDWTCKFWTDRDREAPCSSMEVIRVNASHFSDLFPYYLRTDNYGEKSDLLRYEILRKEGGLYVDHDTRCLQTFDSLHRNYDFYCGLEPPHEPFVERSVTCNNAVLGSSPNHPCIKAIIDWVKENWEETSQKFPGKDSYSKSELVMRRTYIALTKTLQESYKSAPSTTICFPAAYFFAKTGMTPLYSTHSCTTTWSDAFPKAPQDKSEMKELHQIEKKCRNLQLSLYALLALNLAFFFPMRVKKQ